MSNDDFVPQHRLPQPRSDSVLDRARRIIEELGTTSDQDVLRQHQRQIPNPELERELERQRPRQHEQPVP